jgi:hypothetical protein
MGDKLSFVLVNTPYSYALCDWFIVVGDVEVQVNANTVYVASIAYLKMQVLGEMISQLH